MEYKTYVFLSTTPYFPFFDGIYRTIPEFSEQLISNRAAELGKSSEAEVLRWLYHFSGSFIIWRGRLQKPL